MAPYTQQKMYLYMRRKVVLVLKIGDYGENTIRMDIKSQSTEEAV